MTMEVILPGAFDAVVGDTVPVYIEAGEERARVGTATVLDADGRLSLEFYDGRTLEFLVRAA